jgi:hypothetical protein
MIPPGALFMHGAVAVGKARRFCGDSNYLRVVYCTERELSRKEMLLIMPTLVSNIAAEPQLNKKKRFHRRDAEFAEFGMDLNQKVLYSVSSAPLW